MSQTPRPNPLSSGGQAGAAPWSLPFEKIDASEAELVDRDALSSAGEQVEKGDIPVPLRVHPS